MINIGVVGLGYWGPKLLRNLVELDDVSVAVCDIDDNRIQRMVKQFPNITMTTTGCGRSLRHVDAVVVATPSHTHYQVVKEALLANKHVLVEKPLAMSVVQAKELVELADQRACVLMVGHTFLYNAAVRKVKDCIDNGDIGNVRYLFSQRLGLGIVRKDVNAMWNFAPHDISIALYLLGGMPIRVSARGLTYLQPGIEDVVFMHLGFANGSAAEIHVGWLHPKKVRQMTIVGSERMIVYDDVSMDEKVKLYDMGIFVPEGNRFGEFQLRTHYGDVCALHLDFPEPLKVECQHFIDCIGGGKQPMSDGVNGLQVVSVLEAGQKSLEHDGQWMWVE